ncbi:glycosyl hydrolase family 18 protein [Fervidibacillus albus]|uniref:Glycosyl hydrolase family 18 protein n=1 Tax=Fervidibacillus albus TaxID=2980026 RepID=A0A9E8RTY1_9BACI|nr:glycosyl hydrolase family 18 protein [Fervidibacillus albus]WAA08610.1 glycosyl hydrolase family 18 protein [Fervidibacillus albus]
MKKLVLFLVLLLISGCGYGNEQQMQSQDAQYNIQNSQSPAKLIRKENSEQAPDEKRSIHTIGFLEPITAEQAVSDLNGVSDHLSYVAFFSYRVNGDGSLVPIEDSEALAAVKKAGAIPMMVITNFTEGNFSPDIAYQIFTDKTASKSLINGVIQTMKAKGYKALNIDFEHIREQDRELYNGFLETIIPQVRKAGFTVSTALAPKTSDEQGGAWHGAHDYKRHGELADFVILMTYEWGWSGGPPMAVSPIPQVRKVLDYAVSVIPQEKIVMGAPLYGYDWTLPYEKGGEYAKRIAPAEAVELAAKEGVEIQFDDEAQAPWFRYADDENKTHEVWFENEQSMQAKFQLVNEYGLKGVAYWVLGEPFPENWTLLEKEFHILKN